MFSILIVDDDLRMRQLIEGLLKGEGYNVASSGDSREALMMLQEGTYDIVITDLKMAYVGGMDILSYAKKVKSECLVIMITAHGTVESAIEAIRKGAYDYIQKPFDPDHLALIVKRAAEHCRVMDENKKLSEEVGRFREDDFIGTCSAVLEVKRLIGKVAPLDTTVLIQGETGTGKELIARRIHQKSSRAAAIFLPVHCGALSETLLESELFGHERGAFTGAVNDKKGFFETANNGTIFLDEINNTSPAMQVKLLRVLQESTIARVGSANPLSINVRVIAASSANLPEEVAAGRFRKDLFYRLNVMLISLPPLRERIDDIPLLSYHFLHKYCMKFGKAIKNFAPEPMKYLCAYSWPGNVRELEHVIERAVIMESSAEITSESIPGEIGREPIDPFSYIGLMKLEEMEKFLIQRTLRQLDGQKSKAAEALGIDATTLWRKINKYNLQ